MFLRLQQLLCINKNEIVIKYTWNLAVQVKPELGYLIKIEVSLLQGWKWRGHKSRIVQIGIKNN